MCANGEAARLAAMDLDSLFDFTNLSMISFR
jgi:hypothetical protein